MRECRHAPRYRSSDRRRSTYGRNRDNRRSGRRACWPSRQSPPRRPEAEADRGAAAGVRIDDVRSALDPIDLGRGPHRDQACTCQQAGKRLFDGHAARMGARKRRCARIGSVPATLTPPCNPTVTRARDRGTIPISNQRTSPLAGPRPAAAIADRIIGIVTPTACKALTVAQLVRHQGHPRSSAPGRRQTTMGVFIRIAVPPRSGGGTAIGQRPGRSR
ncbi:Uncharacterised protein [Sphingomonas paucimobilis]|nr:Uncharacterised protein [Sphingomonas paucimobilis]